MKIYSPIGSKDRFLEMYQRVNKIQLNEDVSQEADLAGNAFNALVNNELKIQQTNSQLENGKGFVEIIGLDKAGNSVVFRFEATSKQGDQEGVYGIDSAKLIEFKIKTHSFDADLPEESNTIRKLNAERGQEMIDIVSKLADFSEEAPEVDEAYEDAVKLIDKVPYKNGTENMVQHKQYADQKPTNPELRVDATELQKFVSEVQEFNPDEDNVFKLPPDMSNPDLYDEPQEPEEEEPAEPLTPEEEELNLQAYENLMARNKTSRNPNYSPTMPEIMAEIDRLKNPNAQPKPKTRVLPKEAEPWLEEEIRTTGLNPDVVAQKSLTPEKKREYIEKAKDFLETRLGVEKFFNLQGSERNTLIAQIANQIFIAELAGGNFGVSMNETDYPKQMEIGKEFKTATKFPKPKKVHKTKKTIIKTGVDEDVNDGMSFEPEGDEIEQIAQNKEEAGDAIEGGKADGKSPLEYDPDQILKGIEVEKEHTDDPLIAVEIAMDHLEEFSDYYTRLDTMEKQAKEEGGDKADVDDSNPSGCFDDRLMTDVLLGYQSKNVGDNVEEQIVGGTGAQSAVGGSTGNSDDSETEESKKFREYQKRDINTLSDDEKKEYSQLFNKFIGSYYE